MRTSAVFNKIYSHAPNLFSDCMADNAFEVSAHFFRIFSVFRFRGKIIIGNHFGNLKAREIGAEIVVKHKRRFVNIFKPIEKNFNIFAVLPV